MSRKSERICNIKRIKRLCGMQVAGEFLGEVETLLDKMRGERRKLLNDSGGEWH